MTIEHSRAFENEIYTIEELHRKLTRLRKTPPTGEDFPVVRSGYDRALYNLCTILFENGKIPASKFDIDPMLKLICAEYEKATQQWPPFNSLHEGFAVLKEEVDELWDVVRTHQNKRSNDKMIKECKQIAAMALRIMKEVDILK